MPLTTVEQAVKLAADAHDGQVDKVGAPYILHVMRVGASLWRFGDDFVIAGLLHDVLEDTGVTDLDLLNRGLPLHILRAVESVTKTESERSVEAYKASLLRAASDPMGLWVKAADVADNASRLLDVPWGPVRAGLARKYEMAVEVLRGRISGYAVDTPLIPPNGYPHLTVV